MLIVQYHHHACCCSCSICLTLILLNELQSWASSLWLVQVLQRAFTYHWKVWTIPEVLELLDEAGFEEVHVWIRCMIVSSPAKYFACIVDVSSTVVDTNV